MSLKKWIEKLLFTIYRALHSQADVDRLYLKISEGGRGLLVIEKCVIIETNSLVNYIKESNEKVLNAVLFEGILDGNNVGVDKSRLREEKHQRYLAKPLHGQFFRNPEKGRDDKSWIWLKNGKLKKETEGLITAAQDQALRTNSIKNSIDKQQVSPACRLCGERDETVSHIVAECKMLAQTYYKSWRHDKVAQVIHWRHCHRFKINREDNHIPEPVLESRKHKILWDFKIQTSNPIEANKPNIVVFNKESKDCYIFNIACPFDTRIDHKTKEKLEKYQDLRRELKCLWKCKAVKIVPVIIGALGTVQKIFKEWLVILDMTGDIEPLYRTVTKSLFAGVLGAV